MLHFQRSYLKNSLTAQGHFSDCIIEWANGRMGEWAKKIKSFPPTLPLSHSPIRSLSILLLTFLLPLSSLSLEEIQLHLKDGSILIGKLKNSDSEKFLLEFFDGSSRELRFSEVSSILFLSSQNALAQVHIDKAKQFVELGMDDYALEALKAAIRQAPKYAEAHYELGQLLFKLGQSAEALQAYGRAVLLAPGKYGDSHMIELFKKAGDDFLAQKEFAKAAEAYYQLFSLFPRYPASEDAAFKAAFLFADELKQSEKAIDVLKRAIISYPQNPKIEMATHKLGSLYLVKSDVNSAIDTLKNFIERYPNSNLIYRAYLDLAKAYKLSGKKRESAKMLTKIIKSSKDATWVAEANDMMSDNIWSLYTVSDGLPSNSVYAIELDGNYIWVGTASGLAKFKISDGSWKLETTELSGQDVRALAADTKSLWVGTLNAGVMRYDKASKSWKKFTEKDGLLANRAHSLKVLGDEVWLGSFNSGMWKYSPSLSKWTSVSDKTAQSPTDVSTLGLTSTKVWAGTSQKGIFVYDKSSQAWERFTDEDTLESNSIKSCAATKNSIWFGWYDDRRNGIIYYDLKEESWQDSLTLTDYSFAKKSEEPTDVIQLTATAKEVLVATYTGIFIYDLVKESWNPVPFSYPTPLKEYPVRCIDTDENSIWCGTARGIGRLDRTLLEAEKTDEARKTGNRQ